MSAGLMVYFATFVATLSLTAGGVHAEGSGPIFGKPPSGVTTTEKLGVPDSDVVITAVPPEKAATVFPWESVGT